MTAVYITAIIVVALVTIGITSAVRDVALAKHKTTCEHCARDNSKENEA